LVNLWGFGSAPRKATFPDAKEVNNRLEDVGYQYIQISRAPNLIKKKAPVTLDFGSIAKGYAVDEVAKLLKDSGIEDFLVEIGGEVFASGSRKDGSPWRVGIVMPKIEASKKNKLHSVVSLSKKAMATSGDYRNFFEKDGIRYSHIIDPRTGYPVKSFVVSATVLADDCLMADGLATALVVLSPEEGVTLINELDNVECLVLCEKPDGTFKEYVSQGFHLFRRK
jgi:thiamine biosynthesis lipoprotein